MSLLLPAHGILVWVWIPKLDLCSIMDISVQFAIIISNSSRILCAASDNTELEIAQAQYYISVFGKKSCECSSQW